MDNNEDEMIELPVYAKRLSDRKCLEKEKSDNMEKGYIHLQVAFKYEGSVIKKEDFWYDMADGFEFNYCERYAVIKRNGTAEMIIPYNNIYFIKVSIVSDKDASNEIPTWKI